MFDKTRKYLANASEYLEIFDSVKELKQTTEGLEHKSTAIVDSVTNVVQKLNCVIKDQKSFVDGIDLKIDLNRRRIEEVIDFKIQNDRKNIENIIETKTDKEFQKCTNLANIKIMHHKELFQEKIDALSKRIDNLERTVSSLCETLRCFNTQHVSLNTMLIDDSATDNTGVKHQIKAISSV
jgi:polyhydroxyalkanoate synthesis regulator phasin